MTPAMPSRVESSSQGEAAEPSAGVYISLGFQSWKLLFLANLPLTCEVIANTFNYSV
jgi:hypothetical protein